MSKTSLALPIGRWLDSVGRRPALMFSLTGFALASVGAGFAGLVERRRGRSTIVAPRKAATDQ